MPNGRAVERIAQQLAEQLRAGRSANFQTTDDLFRLAVMKRLHQILAGDALPRHEDPDD